MTKFNKFKYRIASWIVGQRFDTTSTIPWRKYIQVDSAGQTVSENTLLSLSAAWACTGLISESIGTLPLNIFEKKDNGRIQATNHPLYYIFKVSPNTNTTPSIFWSAIIASMLLHGNGFAKIHKRAGQVVSLEFVHPKYISPILNDDGKIIKFNYKNTELSLNDILHIPAFGTDGQWGISAISYGAGVFGSALAGNKVANSTFEKGLQKTTALKIPQVLNEKLREEYRSSIESISGAVNAGKTVLLEGGMTTEQIGIDPKDAQLLESRAFSVEEICRWFRVDPSMIGHGTAVSNWGTGLEQKTIGFLTFTIRPLLTRVEQVINKKLIDDRRYYAEFNIEALLRADSAGRASFYNTMINNGTFTRDEVREKENLPKKGGNSDVQTIQSGFMKLDDLGENIEN